MKAAPFDYIRPKSLAEACSILAEDDDARPIAGGQTLVPMMAMRLARPTKLVDIARLPELAGMSREGGNLVIGAGVRQVEAERSAEIRTSLPLLAAALPWVGHQPTRNRGTVGGSVANADPAAEIPLILATLGGSVRFQSASGSGTIAAADFFAGPMMTNLDEGALLTHLEFPIWEAKSIGVGFHEISARKSDFAYVSTAAQVALDGDGKCVRCAIGIGGATPAPAALLETNSAMTGTRFEDAEKHLKEEIAELEIMTDGHASEGYRRRVALGLAIRALNDAHQNAKN